MNKARILTSLQVIIAVGLILSVFLSATPTNKVHVVEMVKMKFVPDKITIKIGDSIKFINKSRFMHNVVVKKLKIRTKYVRKDKSITIKPSKTGRFDYYCLPHKTMGMTGVITVGE